MLEPAEQSWSKYREEKWQVMEVRSCGPIECDTGLACASRRDVMKGWRCRNGRRLGRAALGESTAARQEARIQDSFDSGDPVRVSGSNPVVETSTGGFEAIYGTGFTLQGHPFAADTSGANALCPLKSPLHGRAFAVVFFLAGLSQLPHNQFGR